MSSFATRAFPRLCGVSCTINCEEMVFILFQLAGQKLASNLLWLCIKGEGDNDWI